MLFNGQVVWDNISGGVVLFTEYEDDFAWVYDPFATDIVQADVDDLDLIKTTADNTIFKGDFCSEEGGLDELLQNKEDDLQKYVLAIDDLIQTTNTLHVNR